jgi:transcriptional regulator with XRE-family HTH domain
MAMTKRTALAALIEETREAKGESLEDVAQRARMRGHTMSKQALSKIVGTAPLKTVVPRSLRAIADGLEVPLAQVVEAALPSAGLPLPSAPADWSIESAIQADPELPLPAKRMLLTVVGSARGDSKVRTLVPPSPRGLAARAKQGTQKP